MAGVPMPGENRLPPGPQRELTAAIHDLYVAAGKPGTRKISSAIQQRDDLPDTVSHEAVRAVLSGARCRWQKVESVVRQLAVWSVEKPAVGATVATIHTLWLATDAECVTPACSTDPAILRQAIRGLHQPPDAAAITSFLCTELFVPTTETQGFLTAVTSTKGAWICVFTSIDRLRAYQELTNAHWCGTWILITGTDLIRSVRKAPIQAGILVDPTGPGGPVTETLPLPQHLVSEIAMTL